MPVPSANLRMTMRATVSTPSLPSLLAAAPHRPLFLAGACAVLTSMGWWALQLAATRYGWVHWPQPSVPPGWAHAMLTQYGMLPLFIFGFLLTVFPRWLDRPPLPARAYVPVAGCVFVGYLAAHAGLLGRPWLLAGGVALMLAGYVQAAWRLGGVLMAAANRHTHAWSCFSAVLLGTVGLASFLAFLLGAPAGLAVFAIKLGTFGFLLPMYFTVCHRMIPFFSGNVVPDYVVRRPAWSLPIAWTLLLARLIVDLGDAREWLLALDVPLALLFGWHALAWQPWKARRPGLLLALHLAFAWLPIAFALYVLQDDALLARGVAIGGRAPLHALTIGFFGSMLVAMVTRVTQGHSGRPLQMGAVAWTCFGLLQAVVLVRLCAEFQPDAYGWFLLAAIGWVVAFLPWVARGVWIYLTPRADGRPG